MSIQPHNGHEIRRHNVPRHRALQHELALLDWRRSLGLHLCPQSFAIRLRSPRRNRTVFGITDGCITLTNSGRHEPYNRDCARGENCSARKVRSHATIISVDTAGKLMWLSRNMLREHSRTSEVKIKGPSRTSSTSSVNTLDRDGVSYHAPTGMSGNDHYSQSLRAAWDAMRRRLTAPSDSSETASVLLVSR
jgi:hypothetical protein